MWIQCGSPRKYSKQIQGTRVQPMTQETAFGVRNEQPHWSSMRHSNSDLGMVVFLNQPWEMCVWFGKWCSIFFDMFASFLLGRQDPQSWSYVNLSFYFSEMGVTAWDRRWIWQNHPRWSYELSQPHDSSSQGSGMSNIDSIAILTGDRWWHMALLLFPWEDSDPKKWRLVSELSQCGWGFGGWCHHQ